MDTLIGLGIFLLYCLFVAWATLYAYYRAWRSGSSEKKAWAWGLVGFLAAFMPMWGDIPAKMIGISMGCARDGGDRVYKSYDQWVEENRQEIASVVPYEGIAIRTPIPHGYEWLINNRIKVQRTTQVNIVGVVRFARRFVDLRTGEALLEEVDYSSGVGMLSGIASRVTPRRAFQGCNSDRMVVRRYEMNAIKYRQTGKDRQ